MADITNSFLSHLEMISSPLGTYSYCFETGLNKKHGTFSTVAGQPFCDQFEIASISAAYYLHMLTGYGHYCARNRHLRLRASSLGLQYLDRKKFANFLSDITGNSTSLLDRTRHSKEVSFIGHDPLAPTLDIPFVNHWYGHLASLSMMRNLSAAKASFESDLLEVSFSSYLLAEEEFSKTIGLAQDSGIRKVRAIFDEIAVVRYDGDEKIEITTDSLIQCYMALSEIVIRRTKDEETVNELSKKFVDHPSFSVVQFALYAMGLEQTPHNMAMMASAILSCIELSLMIPPMGSIADFEQPLTFKAYYPPYRFFQAVESIKDLGWPSPIDGDKTEFRDHYDTLREEVDFPIYPFQSINVKANDHDLIREFLPRYRETKSTEFFPWIDWYDAFSRNLATSLPNDCGSITEFFLFQVPKLGEDAGATLKGISPPISIDDTEIIFAGSLMQGFDEATTFLFRSFFFEIANTFWHNSWLGQRGNLKLFPFEVSDKALFGRWLDVPRQVIETHIRSALLE